MRVKVQTTKNGANKGTWLATIALIIVALNLPCFAYTYFNPGTGCSGQIEGLTILVIAFWGSLIGTVLSLVAQIRSRWRNIFVHSVFCVNAFLLAITAWIFATMFMSSH